MKEGKILIVEDDADVSYTASLILREKFAEVRRIAHPDMLMDEMHKDAADVVLLDMNFMRGATSGEEGLRWLTELKRTFPHVQVVLNTAYGDISLAVEGMKRGATDFLVKPW
ncbi:MAG: response regulator, partial [Bacteroidales bacterium]